MKTFIHFLSALLIAGSIAAVAVMAYLFMQSNATYQRNIAFDGCLKASTKTWMERDAADQELFSTTTEPNRYWVEVCMKEKGYSLQTALQ